jgi:hypothetical protein
MRVIAERVSAALACTSEEFCTKRKKIASAAEVHHTITV